MLLDKWQSAKKRLTVAPVLLFLMAALSGLAFGCGERPASTSFPVPPDRGPNVTNVGSAEEASQIAGYRVVEPAFIPEGFEHSGQFALIVTQSPAGETNVNVMQTWISKDDRSIVFNFVQDPKLDGISGGGATEVAGLPGQRVLTAARPYRDYPLLDLYWRVADMAYVVGGPLKGPLDEDVLRRIAASVPTR
jgi:hypothetical protein